LVTAFGREEVREEAERLQLDGFLVKPVTKSMIVDTLVNLFAHVQDEPTSRAEAEQSTQLRGARILLAEDNEINQQIAVELLQGAGATITVANNGREAVEMLSNGPQPPPFDVVLMDLQMPEMDGYQATAKLQSDARFSSVPIIAMTAHATIEERQRCLAAGMVDHISKPIDPASLFETVGRFCKPPGPSAAANPRETSAGAKLKNEPALSGGARPGTLQSSHMTEPEADPDLPAIEGLDTKDGLARVAGNRKLYSKLLRQFGEQNGETIAQISDALKQGDVGVAERLAHTVKGVAGNIGAKPVQTAASKLEKLIREKAGLSETNDAIADLSAVLDPLLAKLRQVYASAPQNTVVESSNTGPVDIAAARMAGERMGQLLAQFDPDAVEALATNQTALRGLFPGDAWLTFEKLVQNYAFADAQVQLEQALRNLPAA